MKTTTNIIYPAIAVCAFACLEFSPGAQAVSPPPDGGYPGGNTAEGQNALFSLTTGGFNTAVGFFSLRNDATNSFNTALGAGALFTNTADENTATGAGALLSNTTGPFNTATGAFALLSNTTGSDNTALGSAALESNTTGVENTAIGSAALITNTGSYNTAVGFTALFLNSTGSPNSAFGWGALRANTEGNYNTGIGYAALYSNTTGTLNTAIGDGAIYSNIEGNSNTAIGTDALLNSTGGDYNIAIGAGAGLNHTDGGNNIYIGDSGGAAEGDTIRIGSLPSSGTNYGACFIGGIFNGIVDPASGTTVYVDNQGRLGGNLSSQRFKRDVKPMSRASEAILALKPVTFHYKTDAKNTPCFGLIAEEVAKIDPALVVRDRDGKPYSVRYDQVNAMLLNEFLKEHKKVLEQQAKITKLESTVATLVAVTKEQAAQIQKVNAQVDLQTPTAKKIAASKGRGD